MRNLYKYKVIIFLLGIVLFASCEQVTPEEQVYEVQKKTILIYMAANNNLASNAIYNLSDLKKGYIPTNDNLLVYYHLEGNKPVLLRIHSKDNNVITDTLYKFPSNTVSANTTTIKNVLNITKTLCPAEKYGLILWSHGTGWLPKGFYSNPTGYSGLVMTANAPMIDPYAHLVKSYGSETDASSTTGYAEMEITELAAAIPYKLEFLIFDACLMGGIEVAYEFKDLTDYFIASPAEILTTGFPYHSISKYMFEENVNAASIASEYMNYYNSLSGDNRSATIGAFKTDGLTDVANAAKVIFEKNRDKILSLDRNSIQRYYRMNKHWFYDLEDFLKVLSNNNDDFANFKTALNKITLYKDATDYFIGVKINVTCGLSTYITEENSVLNSAYKNLAWNKAAQMITE